MLAPPKRPCATTNGDRSTTSRIREPVTRRSCVRPPLSPLTSAFTTASDERPSTRSRLKAVSVRRAACAAVSAAAPASASKRIAPIQRVAARRSARSRSHRGPMSAVSMLTLPDASLTPRTTLGCRHPRTHDSQAAGRRVARSHIGSRARSTPLTRIHPPLDERCVRSATFATSHGSNSRTMHPAFRSGVRSSMRGKSTNMTSAGRRVRRCGVVR